MPGTASRRWRAFRTAAATASVCWSDVPLSDVSKAMTRRGSKPRSTSRRATSVRTIRPQPTSSTIASVISSTTSADWVRWRRQPPSADVPASLNAELEIHARRRQRREHAEENAGRERDRDREPHDVRIERDRRSLPRQARDRVRAGADDRPQAGDAGGEAEDAAAERQQPALGEQLADDAGALRAQRRARRDLAAPPLAAREQQRRHVRASDEQHERHGPAQHPQRRLHVADHRIPQRDGPEVLPAAHRQREFLPEVLRGVRELAGRARDRDVRDTSGRRRGRRRRSRG